MVRRTSPHLAERLEKDVCHVVRSSSQDGWLSRNRDHRTEDFGDRGKAVWYMCWADIWIGRKKWRVNRRQSVVRSSRDPSVIPTFRPLVVNN
jgi:hypothetical protein